jgi:hypothetical protein
MPSDRLLTVGVSEVYGHSKKVYCDLRTRVM